MSSIFTPHVFAFMLLLLLCIASCVCKRAPPGSSCGGGGGGAGVARGVAHRAFKAAMKSNNLEQDTQAMECDLQHRSITCSGAG